MATIVFKKSLRLSIRRSYDDGDESIPHVESICEVTVRESSDPYCLHFLIDSLDIQADRSIDSKQIATELKEWLHSGPIKDACYGLQSNVEKAMSKYVRFGLAPTQKYLIYWILSRSQIILADRTKSTAIFIFCNAITTADNNDLETSGRINAINWTDNFSAQTQNYSKENLDEIRLDSTSRSYSYTDNILGKSASLEALKSKSIKGRGSATTVFSTMTWDNDTHRLVTDIQTHRKQIHESLEQKSLTSDKEHHIQLLKIQKLRKHREMLDQRRSGRNWTAQAKNEVESLQQIEQEIESTIRKEKARAVYETERAMSYMAPNGMNIRGRSAPGPFLGYGPIPYSSTTRKYDQVIGEVTKLYYWDEQGRRHYRGSDTKEQKSTIEIAMKMIHKAASNCYLYKLDLKTVFDSMDASGDGFLTPEELAGAFKNMGVVLDVDNMVALFQHFDPDDSGKIGYGEFMWAFFNRRKFVRKWTRSTSKLSNANIIAKFHLADTNGDGKLNKKEFIRLLKIFNIDIPVDMIDAFMKKFDADEDGYLDMMEYFQFIEKEVTALGERPVSYTKLYAKTKHSSRLSRRTISPPKYKEVEEDHEDVYASDDSPEKPLSESLRKGYAY